MNCIKMDKSQQVFWFPSHLQEIYEKIARTYFSDGWKRCKKLHLYGKNILTFFKVESARKNCVKIYPGRWESCFEFKDLQFFTFLHSSHVTIKSRLKKRLVDIFNFQVQQQYQLRLSDWLSWPGSQLTLSLSKLAQHQLIQLVQAENGEKKKTKQTK